VFVLSVLRIPEATKNNKEIIPVGLKFLH